MKERLGERIRRKRAELKLGLRETAAKVGISPTYLSRIETMDEKTPPAEDVIRKLATLLNDNFDELMQLAGRVPARSAVLPRLPSARVAAGFQRVSPERRGQEAAPGVSSPGRVGTGRKERCYRVQ